MSILEERLPLLDTLVLERRADSPDGLLRHRRTRPVMSSIHPTQVVTRI